MPLKADIYESIKMRNNPSLLEALLGRRAGNVSDEGQEIAERHIEPVFASGRASTGRHKRSLRLGRIP
jgi:hypothetical protein